MLQVFHLDVAKVVLNVAYVVMAIHVCFKCMSVSSVFSRMLQVLQQDVPKVDLMEHVLQ